MRLPLLIAALAVIGSQAAGAATLPPPIAQASAGKMQCDAPDRARKTCRSISTYRTSLDGGIENPTTVLISANPMITMQATSPITIKNGQVCGFVRPEDIAEATFSVDGAPATAAQSRQFRAKITDIFSKGVFGHEICSAYVPDGDGFIQKSSIDGAPQPKMDERVIWISASAGYRVAP
jgi:hypothetical protein